jgi:hypothetical protein
MANQACLSRPLGEHLCLVDATRGRHLRRREAQSGAESIAPVTSGMARRKGKSVPLEELTPGLRVDAGRTQDVDPDRPPEGPF